MSRARGNKHLPKGTVRCEVQTWIARCGLPDVDRWHALPLHQWVGRGVKRVCTRVKTEARGGVRCGSPGVDCQVEIASMRCLYAGDLTRGKGTSEGHKGCVQATSNM